MSIRKLLGVALVSLVLGGCVSQTDFDQYKARIKADGDAVDQWIAATHSWILFINANINTICPGCTPPGLPPDPPPDGAWQ